jgi:hypothetical protein
VELLRECLDRRHGTAKRALGKRRRATCRLDLAPVLLRKLLDNGEDTPYRSHVVIEDCARRRVRPAIRADGEQVVDHGATRSAARRDPLRQEVLMVVGFMV